MAKHHSRLRAASLCLTGAVLFFAGAAAAGGRVPLPDVPEAKGEQCVEKDIGFMRRNHMKLLLRHRDEVMHEGIRTKKYSLKECIRCHAAGEEAATAASRREDEKFFCNSCHSYAAVHIDCFECHATKPPGETAPHPVDGGTLQDAALLGKALAAGGRTP